MSLLSIVQASAAKFREYEQLHRAKGTPDADAKAEVNREMAEMCENGVALELARTGDIDRFVSTARTLAAYALNVSHGANLADFEMKNLVALAASVGCVVTDRHHRYAITRAILAQLMNERVKQVEVFGYTPTGDLMDPDRLRQEVLTRVEQFGAARVENRPALIEAATILVAEIEVIDRIAMGLTQTAQINQVLDAIGETLGDKP